MFAEWETSSSLGPGVQGENLDSELKVRLVSTAQWSLSPHYQKGQFLYQEYVHFSFCFGWGFYGGGVFVLRQGVLKLSIAKDDLGLLTLLPLPP